MSFGLSGAALAGIAIGGGTLLSGIIGGQAAENAEDANYAATQQGMAQQQMRFEAIQKLLAPYVEAGTGALTAQQDLLGLNGAAGQQSAINGVQNSPQFAAMLQQGQNSILSNASATGGLRGGNVQGALGQFAPQLLSQLLQQRFDQLGGLTSIGQNAAAGTGNAGQAAGNNIAQLLQQMGAGQAGNALAQGRALSSIPNAISSGLGGFMGMGGKF